MRLDAIMPDVEARRLATQAQRLATQAQQLAAQQNREVRRRRWDHVWDRVYDVLPWLGLVWIMVFFFHDFADLLGVKKIAQPSGATSVFVWTDGVLLRERNCAYALMPPCGECDLDGRTFEQWNATLYEDMPRAGSWSKSYDLCDGGYCLDYHCNCTSFALRYPCAECDVLNDVDTGKSVPDRVLATCQATFQCMPEQEECHWIRERRDDLTYRPREGRCVVS